MTIIREAAGRRRMRRVRPLMLILALVLGSSSEAVALTPPAAAGTLFQKSGDATIYLSVWNQKRAVNPAVMSPCGLGSATVATNDTAVTLMPTGLAINTLADCLNAVVDANRSPASACEKLVADSAALAEAYAYYGTLDSRGDRAEKESVKANIDALTLQEQQDWQACGASLWENKLTALIDNTVPNGPASTTPLCQAACWSIDRAWNGNWSCGPDVVQAAGGVYNQNCVCGCVGSSRVPYQATLQPQLVKSCQSWASGGQVAGGGGNCVADGAPDPKTAYAAAQAYCGSVQRPWFSYSIDGTDFTKSLLSVTCLTPPAPIDPDYNANYAAVTNASMSSFDIMTALSAATGTASFVTIANAQGYTLSLSDLSGWAQTPPVKDRRMYPQSSNCGGVGQKPCVDETCTFAFPLSFIYGMVCYPSASRAAYCNNTGLWIENDTCVPRTSITVEELPGTIAVGDYSATVALGSYKAVVRQAEYAKFYVPNGIDQAVSCKRLKAFVDTVACNKNGSRYDAAQCTSLTALSSKCSTKPPVCSSGENSSGKKLTGVNIRDDNKNLLTMPLFTLAEWNTFYPGGLKVNANWFDIDGAPAFPHVYPCTRIYGYSVSQGTVATSYSVGNPTSKGVDLLDALVVQQTSNAARSTISIVPNAAIKQLADVSSAVGGFIILAGGNIQKNRPLSIKGSAVGPRTAVGIRNEVDGTQTMYVVSVQGSGGNGMDAGFLARYLKSLGATDAINLDNSGSSQLIYNLPDGKLIESSTTETGPSGSKSYRPIPNFLQIALPN